MHEIHPMPCPTFTKRGYPTTGVSRSTASGDSILQKRLELLGIQRQAVNVKLNTPRQCGVIGLSTGRDPLRLQRRQMNASISLRIQAASRACRADGWDRHVANRFKAPPIQSPLISDFPNRPACRV